MRVSVTTGADWLALWQGCITKKTRRQNTPCAKRRARLRHEAEMRFSRVLHGCAICHPYLRGRLVVLPTQIHLWIGYETNCTVAISRPNRAKRCGGTSPLRKAEESHRLTQVVRCLLMSKSRRRGFEAAVFDALRVAVYW